MTDGHTQRLESALAGRYKVEKKLGEGGMANVYLAEDIKHERRVALKILKPELAAVIGADRFLAEIKTTANLQHPHILPLFDSGEAEGFLYYVMPFIDGETLRDRIERERQLGIEEAVRIAKDVADALDYAHRNGVIHRDIKPANILLHDGRPIVADFGIAVAISAAGGGRMTETGLSLGTPHYMSPEQASADRDLSARSDVYSLGCVLYEMIAGQPPHTGPSAQSILVRILTDTAQPLTELRHTVPPHVAAVVAKSIEKLPADRFDSAKEFMDALGDADFAYAPAVGTSATRAGTGATPSVAAGTPWLADTRSKVAVVALVALALLAGTALATRNGGTAADAAPVTRFDIVDPDPTDQEGLLVFHAAISRDGRRIALNGSDSQLQEGHVVIRDLDGTDLRVLTAGEEAYFPFFSPDGELVAYTVEGAIKVVPVAGGTPRTLIRFDDDESRFIFHWTPSGRLLFSGANGAGGIFAIPAEGADSAELLLDTGTGQVGGGYLLPGDRFLLYHTLSETTALRIADLEGDSSWTLQSEGGAAVYTETGHIIYAHPGQSLFGLPFDLETGQATGRPVPLADSVAVFPLGRPFDVSANGTLVYATGDLGGALVFSEATLVEIDTAGAEAAIPLEPSGYGAPSYSPDGGRIAFSEEGQIVVFELSTGTTTRLTVDGENYYPTWSPDGRELVFRSERDGTAEGDLFRLRIDGTTEARRITTLPGTETPYAWTQGDILVFGSAPDGPQTDILMLALDAGADPVPYLNAPWEEEDARVSPDGRWLAYESDETGEMEIFVRSFPEASGRWQISENGGFGPRWSPDGSALWYWREGAELARAEVSMETTFSVGARRTVLSLQAAGDWGTWALHPDGARFMFVQYGDEDANQQLEQGRFRVVVNWFHELRAQGLLGEGN